MPRIAKFTPPGWQDAAAFRETTLCYLRKEDARSLRLAGGAIYMMAARDAFQEADESTTLIQIRAAHADLAYLQGYLAEISLEPESSVLGPADCALAAFAGKIAGRVASLARALAEGLDRIPGGGAAPAEPPAERP
jgi:hypothetical protein